MRAADQLLPLVYDELRRLAAQRMAHEKPRQKLDATALVYEASLRLWWAYARAWLHVERTRGHGGDEKSSTL